MIRRSLVTCLVLVAACAEDDGGSATSPDVGGDVSVGEVSAADTDDPLVDAAPSVDDVASPDLAGGVDLVAPPDEGPVTTNDANAEPDVEDASTPEDAAPGDVGQPADAGPEDVAQPEDTAAPSLPPDFGEPPAALTSLSELPGSFAEGVASGDPANDGAVVWTRYLGPGALTLEVYEDGVNTPAKTVAVAPSDDGVVQVVLDTLKPDERYFFAFVVSGGQSGRSPIGRFRTAPPPDAAVPVRIAHTGDAKDSYMPYVMGDEIALEPGLAFWIFNGDTVYADGSDSLEDYREHYRVNWKDPSLHGLRAASAYTHTWDDHEFENNFLPWEFPLLNEARQAYFEYHPTRRSTEDPNRLWRSIRWGSTVEVLVLDCRTERSADKLQYLSEEQMSWLESRLLDTSTVFKLIVTSAPIGTFLISGDDRWEGFPTHRKRILDFMSTHKLTRAFWLAADFHSTVLHTLENGSWEFIAGPMGMTLVPVVWNLLNGTAGVDYASGDFDNYHVLDLDPAAGTLTLTVKDEYGQVKYSNTYPHN